MTIKDFWQQQSPGKPLFPDIEWSRPQTKRGAGKLLIIGGHDGGFNAPAMAYNDAQTAGIGSVRCLLPDSLRSALSQLLKNCYFAPSSPSGGFAKNALADFLEHAAWADAVLLAGDFGRNAETSSLIESFVAKYNGLLILAGDAVEPFVVNPRSIFDRKDTLLCTNLGWLQKLGKELKLSQPFLLQTDLLQLVEVLHEATQATSVMILTRVTGSLVLAVNGEVISSPTKSEDDHLLQAATIAAVYWLQQPSKTKAALAASLLFGDNLSQE